MKRFILFVLSTVLFAAGCAQFHADGAGESDDKDLRAANRLVVDKKYDEALLSFDKIAQESAGSEKGAIALFSTALIQANYDNPNKDYAKAYQIFDEFLKQYPKSSKVREARDYRAILKALLDIKKENERLARSIEQLKKIDIRHEEQRKGR